MVGREYPVHLDIFTVIGWIVGGRVHQKSSARKVTHPGTNPALSGLASEVPWDRVKVLGLSHPFAG